MTPRRARRAEVLLALAATLVVPVLVLAAEGALRLFDPAFLEHDVTGALPDITVYSPDYGWALHPGLSLVAGRRRTTIDASGHRDGGPPLPPSAAPVVILGDSVAFGVEVDDAETFAARLREEGVPALNLAVPGWGTDQELLRLRREVGAASAVVLNVCLENDFADNHSAAFFYDGVHPKPYFTLEGGALILHDAHVRSWRRRLAAWLKLHSHLYNRLAETPAATHAGWPERMARALSPRAEAMALTYRLAAEVASVARARGAAVLVVLHPNKEGFRAGSDLRDGFFTAPALAGVAVVDMAEAYRARGLRWSDVALDAMGHLTPAGHAVVAEEIRARLGAQRAAARSR
jgi:hypothetical protein